MGRVNKTYNLLNLTNMKYEYNKLNLTSRILDLLGFSEYWDEHCTWGGRTLDFKSGDSLRIIDQEEMDDDTEGNWFDGTYIAAHYSFATFFATPKIVDGEGQELFFLDDLYDVVEKFYPASLDEFVEKCKSLKMGNYINSYLTFKSSIADN